MARRSRAHRTPAVRDVPAIVAAAGQTLDPGRQRQILRLGAAAVPPLCGVIDDPRALDPTEGRKVLSLLQELADPASIPFLLGVAWCDGCPQSLRDQATDALHAVGSLALEPVLAMQMASWTPEKTRPTCVRIAVGLGVKDSRVLEEALRWFDDDPVAAAESLADYDDEHAIPMLCTAMNDADLNGGGAELVLCLGAALKRLGGCFTADQQLKLLLAEQVRLGELQV